MYKADVQKLEFMKHFKFRRIKISDNFRVSKGVRNARTARNDTWSDMCLQRPVVKTPSLADIFGRRRRRDIDPEWMDDEFFDEVDLPPAVSNSELDAATGFSLELYPQPYCSVVEGMPTACFETSILELFGNDGAYDDSTDRLMASLTDEQVLEAVNTRNTSGIFLLPANFTAYLSGIRHDDESGRIVGAAATYIQWLGRMNMTAAKLEPVEGRVEPMDPRMLDWEGEMLAVMQNTSGYPQVTNYFLSLETCHQFLCLSLELTVKSPNTVASQRLRHKKP